MTRPVALRGDPAQWDWTALRALCLREAQRVLGRTAAAEDAAQEAALKAWRHRASCRTPQRPGPWIATIAKREALRQRPPAAVQPLDAAPEPAVEACERHSALRIDVARALAAVAPDDRRLLLARYWADMTQQEAAELLCLPAGTAKVRLHRLRAPAPAPGRPMKAITSIDDPRYVKALSHPLRVRILALLEERTATPVKLAEVLSATLGTVSYHVRTLHQLGLIELVDETRHRGAVAHHYRAKARPKVTDEAWA